MFLAVFDFAIQHSKFDIHYFQEPEISNIEQGIKNIEVAALHPIPLPSAYYQSAQSLFPVIPAISLKLPDVNGKILAFIETNGLLHEKKQLIIFKRRALSYQIQTGH